jgi:hypothetical protein
MHGSLLLPPTLLTTKTTFLPHCRTYCRNRTSLSVRGRSALSTNSTCGRGAEAGEGKLENQEAREIW